MKQENRVAILCQNLSFFVLYYDSNIEHRIPCLNINFTLQGIEAIFRLHYVTVQT